jgi:hypothetical protein
LLPGGDRDGGAAGEQQGTEDEQSSHAILTTSTRPTAERLSARDITMNSAAGA